MTDKKDSVESDGKPRIRPEIGRGGAIVPALAWRSIKSPRTGGWLQKTLKIFGPGLVTGAADDDPSGIATYSSVGAQFGCGMPWTMLFVFPFMAAIQEISARLGRVTGQGIAGNIRRFYPAWMVYLIIVLLLIANIIHLGADIGAMGAAVELLVGGPTILYCACVSQNPRMDGSSHYDLRRRGTALTSGV
jgi:hypothetical protein